MRRVSLCYSISRIISIRVRKNKRPRLEYLGNKNKGNEGILIRFHEDFYGGPPAEDYGGPQRRTILDFERTFRTWRSPEQQGH